MKEQLYTIPLMDAFREKDECPFCFIHRSLEQHAIDFTLGSGASYMEDDIRFQTDKAGFCKDHYQKMFLYGNRLENQRRLIQIPPEEGMEAAIPVRKREEEETEELLSEEES